MAGVGVSVAVSVSSPFWLERRSDPSGASSVHLHSRPTWCKLELALESAYGTCDQHVNKLCWSSGVFSLYCLSTYRIAARVLFAAASQRNDLKRVEEKKVELGSICVFALCVDLICMKETYGCSRGLVAASLCDCSYASK